MAMEKDTESSGSIAADLPTFPAKHYRHNRKKLEVPDEVLSRLQQLDNGESLFTDFEDQLWLHFERLPLGYASHLNVERAADVLTHIRLLHCAEDPAHRPAFEVHLVRVHPIYHSYSVDSECLGSSGEDDAQSNVNHSRRLGIHPPPAFGPSPNIGALLFQVNESHVEDGDSVNHPSSQRSRTMHEITFATLDKPKLLSQFTSFLLEIGLHIKEVHGFLTLDGFALVVFVIDGWLPEETEQLRDELEREILKSKVLTLNKGNSSSNQQSLFPISERTQTASLSSADYVKIPTDGADVWEIDASLLKFENKVGSGSFGDFYKGTYCSQEVAIKILKPDFVNKDVLSEFAQEVFIMRKIRHKYVVQFIGACTRHPNLCILTEFMSRGSVFDFLHKQGGAFKFPTLLRVALDISKGMNYLHQNNIIHGNLKTANLLMDEHGVVKVADFGVATVQTQSRVMTAEIGTYRWMAPEVIEHEPYDHKADVFSFGVVLWELLTGEVPYLYLTPLQAAVGVVQQGLRPTIPKNTNPRLAELLERCWHQNPTLRPDFSGITEMLQLIGKEAGWEGGDIDCQIFLSTQKGSSLKFGE